MQQSQRGQAGGVITILVVGLLLAVAGGLYLQLIMHPDAAQPAVTDAVEPPASVRIVEGSPSEAPDDTATSVITEKPLPEDQMATIMRTFAPETTN
jgi:hypothetical protein